MSSWHLDLTTNQVSTEVGSKPLLGYEIERIDLLEAVRVRVHPDDVEETLRALKASIRDRKPYHHEYRQIQADGSYRWMSSRATPQYDDRGEPVMMSGVMADVTERKLSEDRYRAITELTPQFVWISDEKGGIVYSNNTLLNYMGIDQTEVLVDRWVERLHPDDRENTLKTWTESLRTGKPYEIEFRIRAKDGTYGWFLNRALPMARGLDGRIDRWLGVSTDITKLKETEFALAQSEDRFRTLAQSIAQFVWTASPDGARTWYNQRWYDYTGTQPDEVLGSGWIQLQHPDHVDRVVESYHQSMKSGKNWEITLPLKCKLGQWRWFLVLAVPIKDEQGKIIRWLGTGTDVTEERRNRENLTFLSDASSILASSLDYNDTLQRLAKIAVPKLADWCSISILEASGPKSVAVEHPDPSMMELAEEFRTKYPPDWTSDRGPARVLRTGQAELHDWVSDEMLTASARDAGHLTLLRALKIRSVMLLPIVARGNILGVLTLISSSEHRKYTEMDLKIAEEVGKRAGLAIDNSRLFMETQEAVKMRDEFLSIASHELKTPITGLSLQLQMAKRRFSGDPKGFSDPSRIEKLVDTTSRQVVRLSKLVDDMLDISRIAHGKLILNLEQVDLGSLVKDVVERFQEQLTAAGCECRLDIQDRIIGAWDRFRLEQVVTNLITNVIKYGPRAAVDISVSAEERQASIVVKDHGSGIAPENLGRIFERFERAVTGNGVSGLGLGLYISRQIVEAHEGSIRAESEIGKGTVFFVHLPL
jgi:PAS domain S-box-containing protein